LVDWLGMFFGVSLSNSPFKENAEYHSIRKPLEEMDKYCKKRFLGPAQKKGVGKCFYNSNIVKEFDAHYKRAN